MTDEDTLDPATHQSHHGNDDERSEAVLVVLLHTDLSRVGETCVVSRAAHRPRQPLVVGRDSPLFSRGPSSPARTLGDPCISRRQLTVAFDAVRGLFHIGAEPGARRSLSFMSATGAPFASPGGEVPPGTLVALGDRVVLGLVLRSEPLIAGDLGMVGEGPAMTALRRRVSLLAARDELVLVQGDSGSGKELVARALHAHSPRARGPFIAVNCAALPQTLAEGELFGHMKGAYTGALGAPGLFRAASGGTLFLDEVGELPLDVQAKLLRAIESRTIRPLGATTEQRVDVRIVAATHRSLPADVDAGRFRDDLYARMAGLQIDVPPLRERPEDVPLLFANKLLSIADAEGGAPSLRLRGPADQRPPALSLAVLSQLLSHPWALNVRELERVALSTYLDSLGSSRIRLSPLPQVAPRREGAAPQPPPSQPQRERPDEATLRRLLDEHDNVQSRVANALGVPPATFDRWLRDAGIRRPRDIDDDTIRATVSAHNGDIERAAAELRISARGLILRLREMGDRAPSRPVR